MTLDLLTDRETDTVIAALRLWQLWQTADINVYSSDHVRMIVSIADEHGPGLTNEEIDHLIEHKINV